MKILIPNLRLTNTVFNKFLIISNKNNIGFLFKFYHVFSEQHHIFAFRSLFANFESQKSVEFPMQEVQNSNLKHFHLNASSLIVNLKEEGEIIMFWKI